MLTTDSVSQQFYRGGSDTAAATKLATRVHTVADSDPNPLAIALDGMVAPDGLLQITHNGLVLTPLEAYRVLTQDGRSIIELRLPRDTFTSGDTVVALAQLL